MWPLNCWGAHADIGRCSKTCRTHKVWSAVVFSAPDLGIGMASALAGLDGPAQAVTSFSGCAPLKREHRTSFRARFRLGNDRQGSRVKSSPGACRLQCESHACECQCAWHGFARWRSVSPKSGALPRKAADTLKLGLPMVKPARQPKSSLSPINII